MWKIVRRSLLLGALLLSVAVNAQNSAAGSDVLVTMPINIDGTLKDLQLMRGESFEAAATSFARSNGLMDRQDDDRLSFPLTVDTYSGEVRKYEGETVEACVERFLYETGFNMDVMRSLFPQIVVVVNQKLAELQAARKEVLVFELTIDGAPAVVHHFEGGNPMEEAILVLRSIDINDGELADRLVPQIANEITRRLNEMGGQSSVSQQQPPQQHQAQKELFSIPLAISNQAAVLVHVEGLTTRESALRFLNDNGVTDPETIGDYLPQLVELLDNHMSEYIRDEAAAAREAAAAQRAQAPPAQPPAPEAPPTRRLLLTLPINLGDNRSANLEYYEGDSIERAVELFLQNVGLAGSASFDESVAQLAGVIRQRLATMQQEEELLRQQQQQHAQQQEQEARAQASRPEPIIPLPVTLSGKVYDLEYFEGQEPGYVANTFCVEKHELVRAELGHNFDGNQLQECKNVLVSTINNMLAQRAQQPQAQEQQAAATSFRSTATTTCEPLRPRSAKSTRSTCRMCQRSWRASRRNSRNAKWTSKQVCGNQTSGELSDHTQTDKAEQDKQTCALSEQRGPQRATTACRAQRGVPADVSSRISF